MRIAPLLMRFVIMCERYRQQVGFPMSAAFHSPMMRTTGVNVWICYRNRRFHVWICYKKSAVLCLDLLHPLAIRGKENGKGDKGEGRKRGNYIFLLSEFCH